MVHVWIVTYKKMVTILRKEPDFTAVLSTQCLLTTHFKLHEEVSIAAANVYITFISVPI